MKKIHLTGVCGVAMGSLACMLKERGFTVTGSDENIYPPMSAILQDRKIGLFSGYRAGNVGKPDLAIIGNSISRGNPEVEYLLDNRIPYMSMAQAIYTFFLHDKEVINISGTHGKSTTTALLAHILETAGEDPSFLVGATSKNHGSNYRLGKGRYFVIEGDEYDSAFFEKVPKFMIYRPGHLVLTSLEFDHADIYKDLDEITLWFRRLVNMVPSRGQILYCGDYPALAGAVKGSLSEVHCYGRSGGDFHYQPMGYAGEEAVTKISMKKSGDIDLRSMIFGEFNSSNIAAAASMALLLGTDRDAVMKGVGTFKGVLRRQDLIYESGNIRIYEDFAHHPTAITSVLDAMRDRFSHDYIWAVYEPRSATSRRNVFQDVLHESFRSADAVLIKSPYRMDSIKLEERMDIDQVCKRIAGEGKPCFLFNNTESIIRHILDNININVGNTIVIMSNGGFDGIYSKITGAFKDLP